MPFEDEAHGHVSPTIGPAHIVVHRIGVGEDLTEPVAPGLRRLDRFRVVVAARDVFGEPFDVPDCRHVRRCFEIAIEVEPPIQVMDELVP